MPKGTALQNLDYYLIEHKEINPASPYSYLENINSQIQNEREAVNDYVKAIEQVKVAAGMGEEEKQEIIAVLSEILKDEQDHIKKLELLQRGQVEQAKAIS